jgi:hypothetical protein
VFTSVHRPSAACLPLALRQRIEATSFEADRLRIPSWTSSSAAATAAANANATPNATSELPLPPPHTASVSAVAEFLLYSPPRAAAAAAAAAASLSLRSGGGADKALAERRAQQLSFFTLLLYMKRALDLFRDFLPLMLALTHPAVTSALWVRIAELLPVECRVPGLQRLQVEQANPDNDRYALLFFVAMLCLRESAY